ncbi:MAG: hypothetical protein ACLGIS_13395 [Actinomycetes bacterium]|uniref:hypothetical protein n=1 Tax=Pseudarthrobacter phenanthrenivorans TaxID=361575 RepID=UPI001FEC4BDC|nr:hypothetical protein [Pseudarthrobacter phenanthrenivorans]
MMEDQADRIVRNVADLAVGDIIEAWHDGRCHYRGKVLHTVQSMGMFWILDSGSGTRKLVDFEALLVSRITEGDGRSVPSVA